MRPKQLENNTDMDTILTTGFYYNSSNTIVNGGYSVGIWLVFAVQLAGTIYAILQVACDPRSKGIYPLRYRVAWTDNNNGWSVWKNIPATNVDS